MVQGPNLPIGAESEFLLLIYHLIFVPAILIDLYIGQRMTHDMTLKEALTWVIIWISLASMWGILILLRFGIEASALYFASYVVEYSLSVDNLFVFLVIFQYFNVPFKSQHKTLYIGILTAVILRGVFIFGGIALIEMYHWIVYIFAIVLIISGIKLATAEEAKVEPEKNPIVRLAKKYLPITHEYEGSKFIVRRGGRIYFTPLIIVLLAIETTDVMFAFDSVPAVIAITQNFFLAYTSNISAVLGLRSLYFALAIVMFKLRYLSKGLAIVLTFLGIKIFAPLIGYKIPLPISIGIVLGIIFVSVILSIFKRQNNFSIRKM